MSNVGKQKMDWESCMIQEKWQRLYRETKWGTLLGVSYANRSSLLKRYMKSKCWGLDLQAVGCPSLPHVSLCHYRLDTACQVVPEESNLGASSAEKGKKKKKKDRESRPCYSEKLLCSCKDGVLEDLWSLISIWFLAHHFNQKKKRKCCKVFKP